MSKTAYERAFQELNDDEIASVMAMAVRAEFEDGTLIMREGDPQDRILVILDGNIRVVRLGAGGSERDLTDPLGPGETVGEMSFVDRIGASATLIAKGNVTVDVVNRDHIASLTDADPTFAGRFYRSLLLTVIRRLRQLDHRAAFPA